MDLSADPSISELLTARRSVRAFDTERDLSAASLGALVDAARSAPSAYNLQPWRLWIARRGTGEFAALVASLEPYNALWAHRAAALMVGIVIEREGRQEHPWALYDLGQATALMSVEATRRGIGMCQMAGLDDEAIAGLVGLGPTEKLALVTAVGYAGGAVELTPETATLARRAHERKPVAQAATIR